MNHPMHQPNAFEKLAALQEAQLQQAQPSLTQTKRNVLSRLDERRGFQTMLRQSGTLKWVSLAAAVLVIVGAAAFMLLFSDSPNSAILKDTPSRWIVATADTVASHEFADGSSIVLSPNSAARVLQSTPHSVRVSLENGEVTAEVIHADQTRWLLEAGPYTVKVTGTRFSLGWNADASHFSLVLKEGSVLLHGPMIEDGKRVQRGERVDAWPENKRVEITGAADIDDGATPTPKTHQEIVGRPANEKAGKRTSTPVARPGSLKSPSTASERRSRSTRGKTAAKENWSSLCSQGEFQQVLGLAREKGIHAVLRAGALVDLMALGEAARLTRHATISNDVYQTIRQRFPGTPQSSTSAFYLGKIAFDQRHAYGRAARWLDVYLREAPSGPFARDALGKLIESQLQIGQRETAAQNATRYINSYPQGPHVGIAQKALGAN